VEKEEKRGFEKEILIFIKNCYPNLKLIAEYVRSIFFGEAGCAYGIESKLPTKFTLKSLRIITLLL
jgi:hypothetical protein